MKVGRGSSVDIRNTEEEWSRKVAQAKGGIKIQARVLIGILSDPNHPKAFVTFYYEANFSSRKNIYQNRLYL